MDTYVSAGNYKAQVAMQAQVNPAQSFVLSLPKIVTFKASQFWQYIRIADLDKLNACAVLLKEDKSFEVKLAAYESQRIPIYVVYLNTKSPVATQNNHRFLTLSEFLEKDERIPHVSIVEIDVPFDKLVSHVKSNWIISLRLCGLNLTRDNISKLCFSGMLSSLKWLDISGNNRISCASVEDIARAVNQGYLDNLEWLDLSATECNATPYVDAPNWRMTDEAVRLAEKFGFQRWMMLGSRVPELENLEILSDSELELPPSRY